MAHKNIDEAQQLEGLITTEEIHNTLKKMIMSNNKSPGSDRLTKEFYSIFWVELKFACNKKLYFHLSTLVLALLSYRNNYFMYC